jgi:hypothetical protein
MLVLVKDINGNMAPSVSRPLPPKEGLLPMRRALMTDEVWNEDDVGGYPCWKEKLLMNGRKIIRINQTNYNASSG